MGNNVERARELLPLREKAEECFISNPEMLAREIQQKLGGEVPLSTIHQWKRRIGKRDPFVYRSSTQGLEKTLLTQDLSANDGFLLKFSLELNAMISRNKDLEAELCQAKKAVSYYRDLLYRQKIEVSEALARER